MTITIWALPETKNPKVMHKYPVVLIYYQNWSEHPLKGGKTRRLVEVWRG